MSTVNSVPEDKLIKLGKILKEARANKQLSTRALSDLCGTVSNGEISLLENAKRSNPNPLVIKRIAEILDLNYLDLFVLMGYVNNVPEPNVILTPINTNKSK